LKFLWGVATSGHQIDGDNSHSDWWAWEQSGRIEGGVRSGKTTDHIRLFKEDLALAAKLGVNTYRFSFEWSRLEPKKGEWSESAFEWYEQLIEECERLGIIPMATLHHFTSPKWFTDEDGWAAENSSQYFLTYVNKVAERFASRIPLWCTFNEPMVFILGGYLARFMPPGEYLPEEASLACANVLRSHVKAYEVLNAYRNNRSGIFSDVPMQIGFAHNMLDFKPERWWHPIETFVAWMMNRLYNRAWLDAVFGFKQKFWMPGILPASPVVTEARNRVTCDFVGVNYYTKALVHWRPRTAAVERDPELPLGVAFARRKEPTSDLGWSIHPSGFRKMLKLALKYGKPVIVTENGIADRDDRLRPVYINRHLRVLAELIEEGADIRGYYHWSLLDNFEWIKGFWPRFGLLHVDYDTFVRTPRKSFGTYSEIIRSHQGEKPPSREILR
jgi:beta-glucosidase